MSTLCAKSIMRLALVFGTALCLAGGISFAAEKKTAADHSNDPRLGPALNRDAGKRPLAGGQPTAASMVPKTIFAGSGNNPGADATAQDTQAGTTVVDLGGGNLVAAWNDSGSFIGGATHFTGYGWSNNGGETWTDAGALPNSVGGDGGFPVLAFDRVSGAVYLATLGFSPSNIQVFKSTDLGHTFNAPVTGTPGATTPSSDKPWIAVDNFGGTGQGNVYLCWTEFNSPGARILLTRSVNGGASFGPSGGTLISTGALGCFVTVSPNHQVNVAYFRATGSDNRLYMRRSTDFGVTFQPEVMIADLNTTALNGGLGLNGGLRSNSFPHCAVNPVLAKPHQVCIFNDDPNLSDAGDNGDIYIVTSIDGGATWSASKRVNDDQAGDQFFPTLAFLRSGGELMIGYYSRSQDPDNVMFHRRARLGKIGNGGNIAFNDSFQLGPNTPVVIGQDPVVNSTFMGDYDTLAGGNGSFVSVWSDNRAGNAFHARQPDVRAARIAASPAATDLRVTVGASATSVAAGDNILFKVRADAIGGAARDVFVNIRVPTGVTVQSVTGGACTVIDGVIGCDLGTIGAGLSKIVKVTSSTLCGVDTVALSATGTTSGAETNNLNNQDSVMVTILPGSAVTRNYTTGNIATPIPDPGMVEIPIAVGHPGTFCGAKVRLRLNHTFDGDLDILLVAPTGETVELSTDNGGGGDNYGSGTNDCAGTSTVFKDFAPTSITAGISPFAGSFRPEKPLSSLAGVATNGTWKLRITDDAAVDTGTVGCISLAITRIP